jgi:hypothetical protein
MIYLKLIILLDLWKKNTNYTKFTNEILSSSRPEKAHTFQDVLSLSHYIKPSFIVT